MDQTRTTDAASRSSRISFASTCNLVVGAWMILAPFILGYVTGAALWNSIIFGVLVVVFALMRVVNTARSPALSWWNAIFGVWLILAPFVLGYELDAQIWNSVIAGLLILALGAWSGSLGVAPRRTPATTTTGPRS